MFSEARSSQQNNIKASVTFLLEFLDAFPPLRPLVVRGEEEQVTLETQNKTFVAYLGI